MKAYRLFTFAAALLIVSLELASFRSETMLLAVLGIAPAQASSSDQCNERLTVELTPDVENPSDAAFLSSLLSNHVDYQLNWVRQISESTVALDLTGPGPDDQCREVIQTIGNDGRVLSIRADSEETTK